MIPARGPQTKVASISRTGGFLIQKIVYSSIRFIDKFFKRWLGCWLVGWYTKPCFHQCIYNSLSFAELSSCCDLCQAILVVQKCLTSIIVSHLLTVAWFIEKVIDWLNDKAIHWLSMDRMIFPTHEVIRQSQHMKRMSSRVEACSVALLRKTSQQARQSSVANCSKRGRAQVGFVSVLCSSAIFGRTLTIAL